MESLHVLVFVMPVNLTPVVIIINVTKVMTFFIGAGNKFL
jgi:hypothetical protein